MFGSPLQRRIRWRKIKRVIIRIGLPIAVAGLFIFCGGYLLKDKGFRLPKPPNDQRINSLPISIKQIHEAVATGEYDTALELLTQGIKANPDDITLKNLHSQLMNELKVDFKFHYLPGQRRFATAPPSGDLVLTSKDPYYLTVYASDYCYLYIFQLNSSGDLEQHFPSKDVSTPNPMPPGQLRIPNGPYWLHLDDVPGIEKVYLVASRWRHEEFEELSARLAAERESGLKRELTEQILFRIQLEDRATDKLPGLVFGEYQFRHK